MDRKVSRLEQFYTFVLHIISLASELSLPVVCQRLRSGIFDNCATRLVTNNGVDCCWVQWHTRVE